MSERGRRGWGWDPAGAFRACLPHNAPPYPRLCGCFSYQTHMATAEADVGQEAKPGPEASSGVQLPAATHAAQAVVRGNCQLPQGIMTLRRGTPVFRLRWDCLEWSS